MNHAVRKGLRTLLQLVVSGGLTALVAALADGLAPQTAAIVLAGWQVVVTLVQNTLEASGTVPTLLPSPPAPGASAPLAAKTMAGVAPSPAPGRVGAAAVKRNQPPKA